MLTFDVARTHDLHGKPFGDALHEPVGDRPIPVEGGVDRDLAGRGAASQRRV
jgi:hypothetical protein